MSFINYYQKTNQTNTDYSNQLSDGFSYLLTVLIIVLITGLVCIIWFVWAAYYYRYSSDRISDKLLKKYDKIVDSDHTILATNGQINTNKTLASALITIRNKGIKITESTQEVYQLPVLLDCSPMNKKCISL